MSTMTDRLLVVVDATSAGAVQELDKLQAGAKKTDTAFDSMGKKMGITGQTLKAGLLAGATALIGSNLIGFLNDSVEAYGDAAKAAGELATATGGTVEEVSRMQAALEDSGISAEQSAGLITKFTVQVSKSASDLEKLGVELVKNKDGSTDYAATMVDVMDAIADTGDAAERSRLLVQFFGRQGAQSFQELLNSGVSLSEAMETISKYRVFDADDVARAAAYDDAMDRLSASAQGVKFAIGESLIPVVSGAADVFAQVVEAATPVISFLGGIPGPVYLTVGAVTALNVIMKSTFASQAVSMVGTWAATTVTSMVAVQQGAVTMSSVVGGAVRGLGTALAANPVGVVLAAIAAALVTVQMASANAKDEVEEFLPRLKELEDQGMSSADALTQTAEEWYRSASAWDKVSMSWENWGWLKNAGLIGGLVEKISGGNQAITNFKDVSADAREEMGEFAFQSGLAQQEQRELNDLLAEGVTGGGEFETAVRDAAEAQAEQNRITATSKGLIDAYASSTWDAVNATLALFDKQFAAREGQRKYNDQLRGYKDAMTEAGDSTDEQGRVLDDLADSALDAAAALAEQDRQTALNNGTFLTAAEVTGKQIEHLKALRDQALDAGMPQPVIDSLNTYITSLETAQVTAAGGITVQTDINLLTPEQVASKVQELKNRMRDAAQSGNWGLVDAIQAEIDTLTSDKTVTVNTETTYSPGGYGAVKDRKDYLAANVTGLVDIQTTFSPGGYNALKARKDYLAQDRTAYIDIVVRGAEGARRTLDGLGRTSPAGAAAGPNQQSVAPQQVTNNWSVTVNGATSPRAVVRAMDRYVRDNGRPSSVVVRAS